MRNKQVGLLDVTIGIMYEGEMPKPFRTKGDKEIKYKYFYFQNLGKRTCTCIIKSLTADEILAVGVSKCHPKDAFDLYTGIIIAEYKAKIELYKRNIKRLGKRNG